MAPATLWTASKSAREIQTPHSWLSSYVLSLDILTIERGVSSWKSVQGCSVETEESATQPTELSETIKMIQV